MSSRELGSILGELERMAVSPDAPAGQLDAINSVISELFAECGLDPTDREARRAFVLGYQARISLGGDPLLVAVAALRPTVTDAA